MLSIIVPAHNEAARIGPTLTAYLDYFSNHYPGEFEILTVLNDCEDNTIEVVNDYAANHQELRVFEIQVRGKGYALKYGVMAAKGDIIAFTDADGATSPAELGRLVQVIDGGDGIIASRWLPGSILLKKQNLARRIASRGFNTIVRMMFKLPFTDTQCGAKVFKKSALDAVIADVKNGDFTFDVELLYRMRLSGFQVVECGIIWQEKGKSKINILSVVPKMLKDLIRLRINSSRSAPTMEKTPKLIYEPTQQSKGQDCLRMLPPEATFEHDPHSEERHTQMNLRMLAPSYHRRISFIIDLLKKTKGNVLDLGCADGFYSKNITNQNNRVYGVDINQDYLDKTSHQGNPIFIKADASKMPFDDDFFDTAICIDMLEHTYDDNKVIAELYRVIKPNGQLIISVPQQHYPFTYDFINYLMRPFKKHLPIGIWGFGHIRLYTGESLKHALEQQNFQVVKTVYLTHALAAFFENYSSTILQGVARQQKRGREYRTSGWVKSLFYFASQVTAWINKSDMRLFSNSHTSVGIAVIACKV